MRRKKPPQAFNKYIFFILLAVIGYLLFINITIIYHNYELKKENKYLKTSIINEEKAKKDLLNKLDEITYGDYIEELARVNLGLVGKGETAYQITNRR